MLFLYAATEHERNFVGLSRKFRGYLDRLSASAIPTKGMKGVRDGKERERRKVLVRHSRCNSSRQFDRSSDYTVPRCSRKARRDCIVLPPASCLMAAASPCEKGVGPQDCRSPASSDQHMGNVSAKPWDVITRLFGCALPERAVLSMPSWEDDAHRSGARPIKSH